MRRDLCFLTVLFGFRWRTDLDIPDCRTWVVPKNECYEVVDQGPRAVLSTLCPNNAAMLFAGNI